MDFGEIQLIHSAKLHKSIIEYQSLLDPQKFYQFRKKTVKTLRNGQINEYWCCIDCEKYLKENGREENEHYCQITVSNDRLLCDPDVGHHTFCTGKDFGEMKAQILNREARHECNKGRKRPLESHTHMNSEVPKRFQQALEAEQVEANLQEYKSMKSGLKRWFRKCRIPVDDPFNLPVEYQITERGRYADQNSPHFHERWLLCSNEDRGVIGFSADQDISLINQSGHLIMDGTFKVSPNGFTQLYTIHAWGAFQFEAIPACHALMHSKTAESYVYLLTSIRDKLEANHGGLGALRCIHSDFEIAAHRAISQVFPKVSIKGCSFHFSQALNRKLQQLGLKEIWTDQGVAGEWIGCIKALAMLPVCLVQPAFAGILYNLPNLDDPLVINKMTAFRQYFEETWLRGSFAITLWTHWDNNGPRTTNHAEGYHNRLNLSEVRDMHLAVRNFLHLLQPMHNRDQIRVRNLRRGVYLPKQRDNIYTDLDNRIDNAKTGFYETTGHIWDVPEFDAQLLQPHVFQFLMREVHHYLRYMRYLIGKKSRVVLINDNL